MSDQIRGIDPSALDALVAPVLLGHGVELVDVTFRNERGWILRFSVDVPSEPAQFVEAAPSVEPAQSAPSASVAASDDALRPAFAAITLAQIAEVARDLSAALDADENIVPYRYTLEVSSPGPDRPLRSVADLRRFEGRLVKVYLARPAPDGQVVLRGHLLATTDATLTVEVDGKPITVPVADMTRAHLIFEPFAGVGSGKRGRGQGDGAARARRKDHSSGIAQGKPPSGVSRGQTNTFVRTEPQAKEER